MLPRGPLRVNNRGARRFGYELPTPDFSRPARLVLGTVGLSCPKWADVQPDLGVRGFKVQSVRASLGSQPGRTLPSNTIERDIGSSR